VRFCNVCFQRLQVAGFGDGHEMSTQLSSGHTQELSITEIINVNTTF